MRPYLVQLRSILPRFSRSPALHFAVLGTLLFVASLSRQPSLADAEASADRPRLEIPVSRVAEAERAFRAEQRRSPTASEKAELIDGLIDDEVLFHYALRLGLHRSEVPRRRLAQIASFVESGSPASSSAASEPKSDSVSAELAQKAVDLGLHEGDFVTRRVLVDAARRLIRGAARLVEPDEQAVVEYLRSHGERFRGEDRFRISHVLQNRAVRDEPFESAASLLARLRREHLSPDDAQALADPGIVPPNLPLLGTRALERRFGVDFVAGLTALPAGEWVGPVLSRHGAHVVFVHESRPGELPELAQARDKIRPLLREQAADRWLTVRLRQLREGYEVVIPDTSIASTSQANTVSQAITESESSSDFESDAQGTS